MKYSSVIPTPPSVNAMRATVKGRQVLTREWRKWKVEAASWIHDAPRMGTGPFRITIELPVKLRGDIDNRAKAPLDLLQAQGVIDDDKHVADLRIYRGETEHTTLTVETIDATGE